MIRRNLVLVASCLALCCSTPTFGFVPSQSTSSRIVSIYSDGCTHTCTKLFDQQQRQQQPQDEKGAATNRIRFTVADGLTTTTNPLDTFLSLLFSDVASIGLGLVGLLVVVLHRFSLLDVSSPDTMTLQTRTDLLAVFACGSVLLNGITKLDVTAALAESVVLVGRRLEIPELFLSKEEMSSSSSSNTLVWGLESLLVATPAKTAVVLDRSSPSSEGWKVVARAGTVPDSTEIPDSTPILDRVSSPGNTKESYLPTLQALPGKKELPYLPSNAQLALLIPMMGSRVLVLGGNTAKSFTPRDVAWCRIVAERMENSD
jgi:hypothetical protein